MRYLAHSKETRANMVASTGNKQIDDLFAAIPKEKLNPVFDLPDHQDELAVDRFFFNLSSKNQNPCNGPFFIGGGLYRHHVPASVDYLIQRGEFLTSYTPYQPEVAQGTLQYLFEFQTQISMLTGMDVANASMYDGSTGTVEAVLMANRITGRKKVLISSTLHPQYADVIKSYGDSCNFSYEQGQLDISNKEDLQSKVTNDLSCVVVQYPDFLGNINDWKVLADKCHEQGVLLIVVVTEILSLGLLQPPSTFGADIVVGEGQSLGNAINFGGPTVGFFATKHEYVRQMPGRIVGETTDLEGHRGWVLTLSTREQHIRREKATSNICTNAGLCALAFTIHLTLLGEMGFKRLAKLNHYKACQLKNMLAKVKGVKIINTSFFNEFLVELPLSAKDLVGELAKEGIFSGIPLSRFYGPKFDHYLLMAVTEMVQDADMDLLISALSTRLGS